MQPGLASAPGAEEDRRRWGSATSACSCAASLCSFMSEQSPLSHWGRAYEKLLTVTLYSPSHLHLPVLPRFDEVSGYSALVVMPFFLR